MNSVSSTYGGRRIPQWLKSGLPDTYSLSKVRSRVSDLGLNTVCFEARCPNKRHCFEGGAVTFLIMGRNCTRNCRFCNVASATPGPLDRGEPEKLKRATAEMGLEHVIITSVTRDDLPDGGARHFEACIRALRQVEVVPTVEVLTPDFGGNRSAVRKVAATSIDVFGHNIETVERLYGTVRDRASYRRSLGILEYVRRGFQDVIVKSGLILGIGETIEEVKTAVRHIAEVGCDIITMGQYMRPSKMHLPVEEYVHPAIFEELGRHARQLGLIPVCGPCVRSSFRARPAFHEAKLRRQTCA